MERPLCYLICGILLIASAIFGILFYMIYTYNHSNSQETTTSILTCFKDGASDQECVTHFRSTLDHCVDVLETTNPHSSSNGEQTEIEFHFNTCIFNQLGMSEEDGIPNLRKVNDFIMTIYWKMFSDDISDFKVDIMDCVETYDDPGTGVTATTSGGITNSKSMLKLFKCFLNYLRLDIVKKREKERKVEQEAALDSQGPNQVNDYDYRDNNPEQKS